MGQKVANMKDLNRMTSQDGVAKRRGINGQSRKELKEEGRNRSWRSLKVVFLLELVPCIV